MNILVTVDSNYINPLRVMLKSLFINNQTERFTIYLMHSSIDSHGLDEIKNYINSQGNQLKIIHIDNSYFTDAPILSHYTKEMYYRLLAYKFLPKNINRILYLDPDILVINKINTLYNMDIKDYLYAAAYHNKISIREINKLRLSPYEIDRYYNSGVLLMNLVIIGTRYTG